AGIYGNGASPDFIAEWAGCSVGQVDNSCKRVMVALLHLHDDAIRPPTEEEKEQAKRYAEAHTCHAWRNGYISVDGTKVPLAFRPGRHGQAFFDKDRNYSFSVQLAVLLHNLLIVDYTIGHVGSVHDSTQFQDSRLSKAREEYLNDNEWIWADSAYPLAFWCATPFRAPPGGELTLEQKRYNYWVSRLKGRFQFLKELQFPLQTEKQHRFMMMWQRCCLILHNLIIRTAEELGLSGGEWSSEVDAEHQDFELGGEDEEEMDIDKNEIHNGHQFRQRLMRDLFRSEVYADREL
ncbi:hypothetical protein BDW22DRAFT_1325369, partial [Trametopsis cervina]